MITWVGRSVPPSTVHRGRDSSHSRERAGRAREAGPAPARPSLTSLDLSNNQLGSVTSWGSTTYTTEGMTAIADALRVNGSLAAGAHPHVFSDVLGAPILILSTQHVASQSREKSSP